MSNKVIRIVAGVFAVTGLLLFFLLQHIDLARLIFDPDRPIVNFLINRSIRFLINDSLAVVLIFALFAERKYVVFALWVQLAGLILILLPYFILKIYFPAYNGPLISFLHRIILNPTLMLLLIPAFYYQKRLIKS